MAEVNASNQSSLRTLSPLIFTCLLISCCYGQVPLVMWTSEGNALASLDPAAVGKMISAGQLNSYLTSALATAPHTVLLFLQDKLSMEDFTVRGGVYGDKENGAFPKLQACLKAASSPLVLPSLARGVAAEVPALLQEALGTPPLYTDPSSLAQQILLTDPALLVIGLPYSSGSQTKEVLHKNDEIIGKVAETMKARNVPFTAIYTGLQPSRVIEDSSVISGPLVGRSLLQSQETVKPPVMFNNTQGPCILLWADTLSVSILRGSQVTTLDLAPLTFIPSVSLTGSSCGENSSVLVLNYNNVLNFTSLTLTFVMTKRYFPVSARNWTLLEQVRLVYDGQVATFNGSRGIYSPAEYSFHCQSVSSTRYPLLVPNNVTDNTPTIQFTDFQIQGFNVTGDFSYASDCAAFFTPGIWMGLITSLIMVLILTYGLHMLTQLRTMDRFQDPKGPSLSVPLSE
ncbi:V-type proton ATPase subunit S1b [Clupea harengus]|uniref:V-type proton ATPase subunit S1b n=1 Tax=Clupea harengus TaxID=7950 RepID=A0A6P3W5S9_CLUHA|nr:V-type proton ATPase subunit S1b [Clupea harengus]